MDDIIGSNDTGELTIITNGKIYQVPPHLKIKKNQQVWNSMIADIYKTHQFDLYIKGKKVDTFSKKSLGMKELDKEFKSLCSVRKH